VLKLSAGIGLVMSAVLVHGAAHAAAETEFERQAAKARSERLANSGPPTAGFTRSDSLTGAWSVVSIYVQGPQSPRGRWVARRVANDMAAPGWADAATCPALVKSLALLERLAPQRLEIQGMSPYMPPHAYMADGAIQTVWSSGGAQPDGAVIIVEWSSNSGDLARWGQATEAMLAKCWKPDPTG
jgi:hypothetical protein